MNQKDIDTMRSFNRFYTAIIGLLDGHILNSRYTLPELRVLYELYHHKGTTARDIIDILHIDKGYMSRILKKLERNGTITKTQSKNDGRASHIFLTKEGNHEFKRLNEASNNHIADILKLLPSAETKSLLTHMEGIKKILGTINT